MYFTCSGGKRGSVRSKHFLFGMGLEADMNGLRRRIPLPKPEEYASFGAEAFQVRVSRRTFMTIIVVADNNAQCRKDR